MAPLASALGGSDHSTYPVGIILFGRIERVGKVVDAVDVEQEVPQTESGYLTLAAGMTSTAEHETWL